MRKAILFFALMAGLCSLVFADHEAWFSVGHERAFFMDTYKISGETVDTNISSIGVNLSAYRFFGGNYRNVCAFFISFPPKRVGME